MAVLNEILRHFALVDLPFLCEEVDREALLKQSATLVFFVCEDALNGRALPFLPTTRSGDAFLGEQFGNVSACSAAHEKAINAADQFRFLGDHFRDVVFAFLISDKGFIRQADLAIGEAFSLAPCDVFRNGAAFFLCKGRHNGDE